MNGEYPELLADLAARAETLLRGEGINRMYRSEDAQLDCFVNVIKAMGLADELRDHRWQDFKDVYNGPRPNDYAVRMRDAYRKLKGVK